MPEYLSTARSKAFVAASVLAAATVIFSFTSDLRVARADVPQKQAAANTYLVTFPCTRGRSGCAPWSGTAAPSDW